jgi:hypothetical protein
VLARFSRRRAAIIFTGRVSVERQRVNRACKFGGESRIYHAVAVDPGLPIEGFRHDIDPEMRLAARSVARVALMQMGFVNYIEAFGCESFAQLFYDLISCGHDLRNIAR